MDKYEYKIRAEEIRNLIAREEYLEAAKIADTIDWTCVKKVGTLCTISDLYKKVRRYEDAIELLKLADQRNPEGKDITYSLCELYIKTGDVVHAVESYKAFVRIGARDPRRYVLQYKLIVAQDVSLEERIEVLEELKKRDYREKWAYELAYLYHRIGLGTKCVEECDELILWFGEGRYVYKAMELKMLHQPLTPAQQQKYDNRFRTEAEETDEPEEAEDLQQDKGEERLPEVTKADEAAAIALGVTREFHAVTEEDLMNLQVHTNVGEYNTIDLQKAIAEGVQEVLESGDEAAKEAVTRSILAPMYDTRVLEGTGDGEESAGVEGNPENPKVEVFFGETGELPAEEEAGAKEAETKEPAGTGDRETSAAEEQKEEASKEAEEASREALQNTQKVGDVREITGRIIYPADMWVDPVPAPDKGMTTVFPSKLQEEALTAKPPEEIADSLTQEADGQISLVMPEDQKITKQITGQLSIADVMLEWERMKKENEERNREQRYQEVKAQTGKMFNEFEAAVMDSVLEKLEREADEEQLARQADGISPEDEVEEIEEILETGEEIPEETTEETFEVEDEEETEAEAVDAPAVTEGAILEEALEKELEEALNETEEEEAPEEEAPEEEVREEAAAEGPEESFEESLEETETPEETAPEAETAEERESGEEAAEQKTEEVPEDAANEAAEAEAERKSAAAGIRPLTKEEKELFGPYIQSRAAREELARLLDTISMASYTGNVILSGDDGTDLVGLATQIMKEVKQTDSNFSGKVAKITGKGLNEKKVEEVLSQLLNGGLIIESAGEMNKDTVRSMTNYLEAENRGIVVVMADVRRNMERFCKKNPELAEMFNARMHVKALSNEKLVAFARQYALELEYSIDELGILALHTRIEERQTNGHAVTVVEAKEIVDRAIRHSRRKTPAHFFDVLTGKRYDGEDRIILEEKDFQ
ncbi:MAG: hypothetical protein K6F37_05540 [Lachnospiraceae bacterium]|nr:hypothetical protein [Lachnospiraceae bacterium]